MNHAIHVSQCGPVFVWVVCVETVSGAVKCVNHGVSASADGAEWDAESWLYRAACALQNEAETALLLRSSTESQRERDCKRGWLPTMNGLPVVSAGRPSYEAVVAWCDELRTLCGRYACRLTR